MNTRTQRLAQLESFIRQRRSGQDIEEAVLSFIFHNRSNKKSHIGGDTDETRLLLVMLAVVRRMREREGHNE